MTYRRTPGNFASAMTALLAAICGRAPGAILERQERFGAEIGVSASRLRQCANPMRSDSLPLHLACAADVACARAGFGTPLFEAYRRELMKAGAIRMGAIEGEAHRLRKTLQLAAELIMRGLSGAEPEGLAA
ncbi:MAG TPA: hypothetical protein VGO34_14790 [Alphaproteobacteria bacterium]|jgi:hypothetical protein